MRALIQRVTRASVTIDGGERRETGPGLVILLGVGKSDALETVAPLVEKIANLRVFSNPQGRFDRSLLDVAGEALVVSQFTLYAQTKVGRRPDFGAAAPPEAAKPLYEAFVQRLKALNVPVKTGEFGAHMAVEIHNDGPVTLLVEL